MTTYVRIYQTEDGAKAAVARLNRAGYSANKAFLAGALKGKELETVRSAIEDGVLPERQEKICVQSLEQGLSLVSVAAAFGRGQAALKLMESQGTVKSDVLQRWGRDDPAPLSELLGIPTLAEFNSSTELLPSNWTFSSKLGLRLLSKNPTPLSSLFMLPVLTKPKKNWKSSFGLPLLSRNPAPLSSLFGIKLLSKEKRDWRTSFGIPLLSNNPAPLSSLLGMKTIIKD